MSGDPLPESSACTIPYTWAGAAGEKFPTRTVPPLQYLTITLIMGPMGRAELAESLRWIPTDEQVELAEGLQPGEALLIAPQCHPLIVSSDLQVNARRVAPNPFFVDVAAMLAARVSGYVSLKNTDT